MSIEYLHTAAAAAGYAMAAADDDADETRFAKNNARQVDDLRAALDKGDISGGDISGKQSLGAKVSGLIVSLRSKTAL